MMTTAISDQAEFVSSSTEAANSEKLPTWRQIVLRYQQPSRWRATWQLVNTLGPFAALWVWMYFLVAASSWLVVPAAVLLGGLTVRLFILHHDCGHGSFFKSRRANDFWGFFIGVLTFTPYQHWRWEHAVHHTTSGDLDSRGVGDIWTMTVREYLAASGRKRLAYRLMRNPIVLFALGPLYMLVIKHRLTHAKAGRRERLSVHWTNLSILGMAIGLSMLFGLKAYLLIQFTALAVAGSVGIWLFYVQHQFEGVYWKRHDDWDYLTAALQGASFYKLPRILQWFSGNIGYHHIHHLSPAIPNYNLERCHKAEPLFQTVPPITLSSSLQSLAFRLWDEKHHCLVGFDHLRTLRQGNTP